MGCNYYLERKDGECWVLPDKDVGIKVQRLLVSAKKYGHETQTLYVDYLTKTTKRLHIGKSSYGWHFNLCIYPFMNIYSLDDWKALFNSNRYIIKSEDDEELTSDEMLDIITNRSQPEYVKAIKSGKTQEQYEQEYIDKVNHLEEELFKIADSPLKPRHYLSYDEILHENNAVRGYNGLWSRTSNIWDMRNDPAWEGFIPTVGNQIHTEGTYDLTPDWDFS